MLRSIRTNLSQEQVPSLQNNKISFSRRAGKRSLISLAVALAFASGASQIHAAGLGRLSVQSALGQPLRAEVEVTALGKDEVGNVTAKLASQDAFKQAGLEFNPALTGLRFAVDKRADGRHVVRITSTQPINEPFVDLMVELTWPTGRFVREYTFLLDPADLKMGGQSVAGGETRTETVVAPAPLSVSPLSSQAASPTQTTPVTPAPPVAKPVTPPAAPKAPDSPASAGGYSVKRGDTLARIAARNKPASVSLEQAIVAIYRANPSAFLGNVNRMKANVNIAIPDETAMGAVSVAEARQEVRVRSTGFSSYKSRVARAAKAAPSSAKVGQSASGAIGAQVVDGAPKATAQDQVRLSKGNGKGSVGSSLGGGTKEAKVASANALAEANSRVAALEKNVGDLQKLLSAKDKQLADTEARLKSAAGVGKSADGVISKAAPTVPALPTKVEPKVEAKVAPKVETPKIDVPKLELPKIETPKLDTPPVMAKVEPTPVPKPATPTVPTGIANDPLAKFDNPSSSVPKLDTPKVETPKLELPKSDTPAIVTPPLETPKAEVKPVVPKAVVPAPVVERGILDTVQEDYPFALPGLGGLALVGGAYALYSMRRRKKADKFEDSLMEGEAFSANSLFGTTGGQNVDTNVATNASPTRSETGVEVGSTEVDPIAEAEVYIAYGREGQAEEILKEALRKQGDRQAIRMKLLEIYAGRKDVSAFEAVASEMHSQTRGKNEEWPKVVTLGLSIDPSNPLYSGVPNSAPSASGLTGTAVAGVVGLGAAGLGAMGAGFSSASNKIGAISPLDSLQAASQIVPPIPDFMAEQRFGDTKPMDVNSKLDVSQPEALDFDFSPKTTISKAADRLSSVGSQAFSAPVQALGELDLPSLELPQKAAGFGKAKDVDSGMDFSIDLPSLEALTGNGLPTDSGFDSGFGSSTVMAGSATQSAAWQEMATKLDLAAAYEEIGDKDGARELLDEVVKGGDGAQQQKAKAMLNKLG